MWYELWMFKVCGQLALVLHVFHDYFVQEPGIGAATCRAVVPYPEGRQTPKVARGRHVEY